MFLQASVILFKGGGWYPSIPCRWYPSMPCRSPGGDGGVSQHALQVSKTKPKGELEGSGQGGLQAHTGGSPGPHWGGLQAHTWWFSRLTPVGPQDPHPGGLQAHTWGVSRPTPRGCIPTCTEADLSS